MRLFCSLPGPVFHLRISLLCLATYYCYLHHLGNVDSSMRAAAQVSHCKQLFGVIKKVAKQNYLIN